MHEIVQVGERFPLFGPGYTDITNLNNDPARFSFSTSEVKFKDGPLSIRFGFHACKFTSEGKNFLPKGRGLQGFADFRDKDQLERYEPGVLDTLRFEVKAGDRIAVASADIPANPIDGAFIPISFRFFNSPDDSMSYLKDAADFDENNPNLYPLLVPITFITSGKLYLPEEVSKSKTMLYISEQTSNLASLEARFYFEGIQKVAVLEESEQPVVTQVSSVFWF